MGQPRLRTIAIGTGAAIALLAGSTTAYATVVGVTRWTGRGRGPGCYTNKALDGAARGSCSRTPGPPARKARPQSPGTGRGRQAQWDRPDRWAQRELPVLRAELGPAGPKGDAGAAE